MPRAAFLVVIVAVGLRHAAFRGSDCRWTTSERVLLRLLNQMTLARSPLRPRIRIHRAALYMFKCETSKSELMAPILEHVER